MSLTLPNSKKTKDPNYKDAKTKFHSYMMDSQKLITSIENLGSQAVNIAKFYSKFCKTVSAWFPDSPEDVKQSMTSLVHSSDAFEALAIQKFINTLNPSYKPAVDEYQKHIKDILEVEKKRRAACKEFDEEREKLRKAQKSKDADEDKITNLQQSTDALEQNYNKLNNEYIDSVKQFTEERKTELLAVYKSSAAIICQFINECLSINYIPFPGSNAPEIINGVPQNTDDIIIMDHNTLADRNNEASNIPPTVVPTAGAATPAANPATFVQSTTSSTMSLGITSTSSSTYGNFSNLSTSSTTATSSYTPSTSTAESPLKPTNPEPSPLTQTTTATQNAAASPSVTATTASTPPASNIPAQTPSTPAQTTISQTPISTPTQQTPIGKENDASLSNNDQNTKTTSTDATSLTQDSTPTQNANDEDDDYMNMTNPFD